MDHFQIPNMPKIPPKIHHLLEQLVNMSKEGEINFAFAFAYPDQKGHQWFEAHTGGNIDTLKAVLKHDTNVGAEVKLMLEQQNGAQSSLEKVYFHQTPTPLEEHPKQKVPGVDPL